MNVEELLEVLRARVPGVAAVYLFGSSEHGTEHADSDIDLAVLAASKLDPAFRWELQEDLAVRAGRGVDLVDLASASTVMRMQVVSTGRLLFSTDRAAVDRFEMLVLADYCRLNEERAAILDDANLYDNRTRQDAILLNLQRACESAIDLAMHLVRIRRLGIPQESRDAFAMLAAGRVLDTDLATRLQKMVGFRNIAVHDYERLNLVIVRAILTSRLSDFEQVCRRALELQ